MRRTEARVVGRPVVSDSDFSETHREAMEARRSLGPKRIAGGAPREAAVGWPWKHQSRLVLNKKSVCLYSLYSICFVANSPGNPAKSLKKNIS